MKRYAVSISSDAQGWLKTFDVNASNFALASARACRQYRQSLKGKRIKQVSIKIVEAGTIGQ